MRCLHGRGVRSGHARLRSQPVLCVCRVHPGPGGGCAACGVPVLPGGHQGHEAVACVPCGQSMRVGLQLCRRMRRLRSCYPSSGRCPTLAVPSIATCIKHRHMHKRGGGGGTNCFGKCQPVTLCADPPITQLRSHNRNLCPPTPTLLPYYLIVSHRTNIHPEQALYLRELSLAPVTLNFWLVDSNGRHKGRTCLNGHGFNTFKGIWSRWWSHT